MVLMRLTLDLYGKKFKPSNFIKLINTPHRVLDINDKTHTISINHPYAIGVEYELTEYEKWYIDFIKKNYNIFKNNGIEEINIFMDIFYRKGGQCNFEILDRDMLKVAAKYNIALPISIYALTKTELKEYLFKEEYSKEKITKIFRSEY